MKLTLQRMAAIIFLCSCSRLSATPLLLRNYNPSQTDFAESRAEALGLSYERIADFTSADQLKGKSVVIMPGFTS
jgi:hypothetical protein